MKKTNITLIAISLLLQSCYSYKTINPSCNNIAVGSKYKIQQEGELEKVKVKSITDSTITVYDGKNEKQIQRKNIVEIQEKQLSAGATIALIVPVATITLVGVILTALFK